jgi:hypothetical protein
MQLKLESEELIDELMDNEYERARMQYIESWENGEYDYLINEANSKFAWVLEDITDLTKHLKALSSFYKQSNYVYFGNIEELEVYFEISVDELLSKNIQPKLFIDYVKEKYNADVKYNKEYGYIEVLYYSAVLINFALDLESLYSKIKEQTQIFDYINDFDDYFDANQLRWIYHNQDKVIEMHNDYFKLNQISYFEMQYFINNLKHII